MWPGNTLVTIAKDQLSDRGSFSQAGHQGVLSQLRLVADLFYQRMLFQVSYLSGGLEPGRYRSVKLVTR